MSIFSIVLIKINDNQLPPPLYQGKKNVLGFNFLLLINHNNHSNNSYILTIYENIQSISMRVIFNSTKIYTMICLLFIFLLFLLFFYFVNLNSLFNFCKIHVYSTLYLIMKFLGYAIYLMVDSNDFLTKYFLNNLISCIIFLRFFFSNGNSLIYTVKIFF